MEVIHTVSPLGRIRRVRLDSRRWTLVWSQFRAAEVKACGSPHCEGWYRCHPEPSAAKNLGKLRKWRGMFSLLTFLQQLCLTWKCGSNPFQNYYFLYSKVLKTWFLLISAPWQENDTFGAKALKLGLLGEGGGLLLSSPQTVAGAKNVHTVREVCSRPLLNFSLLSSINLFALLFVGRVLKCTSQSSMWPPEGIFMFVVKFSVIT